MLKTHKRTIEATLAELEGRLQGLRTLKEGFLQQASEVDSKLKSVHMEYARLVNRTVPVSSLPNEVLAAIFEAGNGPPLPEPSTPFKFLVSHVCKHWREVALATSGLWTCVDACSASSLELVDEYLQRSKGHALDVHIDLRGPNVIYDEGILQVVIGHVSRWRHLSITSLSFDSMIVAPRCLRQLTAPILESMELTLDDDTRDDFPEYGTKIFLGGAPALTRIRVHGNCLRYFMPPLGSLQVLHLYEGNTNIFMPYTEFHDMLKELSSLKHLLLRGYTTNLQADHQRRSILMPSLRTVDIQGAGVPISLFLYAMPAPLLESLIAGEATQTGYNYFYSLQINEPYFPGVRTFTLRNSDVGGGAYHTWTRVFPNIVHFSIVESSGDVFLRHISAAAAAPPWPELRTVSLLVIDEIGLLLDAVRRRIAVGCPLVRLGLSGAVLRALEATQSRMSWLRDRVQVEEFKWDQLEPGGGLDWALV